MSTPRILQRQRIRVWDGTEVCVYEAGCSSPEKATLVFANGLGGPVEALLPQIQRFSRDRRVLTWDYRGLYGSRFEQAGRDMSVAAHARDLLDILRHTNASRVAIFGWSMGVQVAFEFAARAPEKVQGLVLLNGTAGKPLDRLLRGLRGTILPTAIGAAKRVSPGAQKGLELASRSALTAPLLRATGLLGRYFPETALRGLLPHFAGIRVERYLELLDGLATHDADATLAALRAPTLVLGSSADHITPAQDGRRLAARIRDAEYRAVSWASHYAALEAPDQVFELSEEFLSRRVDPVR